MKRSRLASQICLWLFLFSVGCLSAIWWLNRPLIGDDIFYALDLRQRGGRIIDLPGQMAAVWMGCNARMGDIINTVWLEMVPRWVGAIICFFSTIALPLCIIKIGGAEKRVLLSAFIVAATVWLLPWWDLSHLVCIINYPWGASLALLSLIPLTGNHIRSKWWIAATPIAFFAGAYHEALGLPLAFGLTVWLIFSDKNHIFNSVGKLWIYAIIAGGLFTLTSPAIWNRLESHESYASVIEIILSSANLSIILIVLSIIIIYSNFQLAKRLFNDVFLPLFLASISSAFICALSGIEGRTGFFSQVFALAALSRIVVISGITISINQALKVTLACIIYIVATVQAIRNYQEDYIITSGLRAAYKQYPVNPEAAYDIIMNLPEYDEWDAASLKCLDPDYNSQIDRNISFPLQHEIP